MLLVADPLARRGANSPGVTLGLWPTRVIKSRSPLTLCRWTPNPVSALRKVARSTRPATGSPSSATPALMPIVPRHWTPEQALAVWSACTPRVRHCGLPMGLRFNKPGAISSCLTARCRTSIPTRRSDRRPVVVFAHRGIAGIIRAPLSGPCLPHTLDPPRGSDPTKADTLPANSVGAAPALTWTSAQLISLSSCEPNSFRRKTGSVQNTPGRDVGRSCT
jgi:hypothetical protein